MSEVISNVTPVRWHTTSKRSRAAAAEKAVTAGDRSRATSTNGVPGSGMLGGGSPMEIMRRTADVYVHWAAEHPSLHRLSDADSLAGDGPMQQMVDRISRDLSSVIIDGFEAFGAPMSDADRAATDPLIYGIVGFWFGVIRRWVNLGASDPEAAHLIEVLVDSTWPIIDARGRSYGLQLDPNAPNVNTADEPEHPDRLRITRRQLTPARSRYHSRLPSIGSPRLRAAHPTSPGSGRR